MVAKGFALAGTSDGPAWFGFPILNAMSAAVTPEAAAEE